MIFPRLTVIEDELALQPHSHLSFNIAVLRNVTVEGLEPYLRYAGMHDCLNLCINWGDYDNILQEANCIGSGVINDQVQAIIVVLWLPAFSEILGFTFASVKAEEIEAELLRVRDYCSATLRSLRERSAAPILWLGFEPPSWPNYGILDASAKPSQRAAIASLNVFLSDELEQAKNAWLVDTGACLERIGAANFYDWRFWHMAHAPHGRAALAEIAAEVQKHLRALTGRVRKCLILDCDNTLWGGIVGEDGVDGVRIGTDHPGIAYREFQLEVLNLYHRGVILGLCSKNNERDVRELLRVRSDMVLREEHFSIMRVNWQDKVTNLKEIAVELNIDINSIVFVDDSAFEVNLVRSSLPDVATLHVSASKPYENRGLLAQCGLFDTHVFTEEDLARSKMYQAEVERKILATSNMDISQYLCSLKMSISVEPVSESQIDRATQLCQRTNQFNLTTKRYTRDELVKQMLDLNSTLLLLRLSDRFGGYGIVGFCMMIHNCSFAHIDTFLLSCRSLGRSVETAFLAICAEQAASKGAKTITAAYTPTNKNAQVASFYQRHGFIVIAETNSESQFILHWKPDCIQVPAHFTLSSPS